MIIFDLSNLLYKSLYVSIQDDVFHEAMLRHVILNIIQASNTKFRKEYGRIVIACDSKQSWRKEIFPPYKGKRKEDREKQSTLNWDEIFKSFLKIKEELTTYTKWPIIEVDRAEGDDIIFVLSQKYSSEKNIIISEDEDFIQIQAFTPIKQWSILKKTFLKDDDPYKYLVEHILQGDKIDGIPNILSDDTCIIEHRRQTALTQKIKTELLSTTVSYWSSEFNRNWNRNKLLIDLREIPLDIQKNIEAEFENQKDRKIRKSLLDYFIKYNLKEMIEKKDNFREI